MPGWNGSSWTTPTAARLSLPPNPSLNGLSTKRIATIGASRPCARELNGPFLDALIAEGADRAAFLDLETDLTADDGMTDYGTATDKIALISDGLYRKFRALIPKIGCWWWTLTPWTCDPEYSCRVRRVNSSGALDNDGAYYGAAACAALQYEI